MSPDLVPKLWMALALLAAATGGLGAATARRGERRLRRRLRSLPGADVVGHTTGSRWRPRARCSTALFRTGPGRDAALAASTGLGAGVVLGGAVGWVLGIGAACALWRWLRRRRRSLTATRSVRTQEASVACQLPLAAELLAACLTAGSGPGQAAEAVGRSLPGPLGERLTHVASELRLGGEPALAWGRFAELPGCTGLARCMERAGTAGVPAVDAVSRLAAECRAGRARAAAGRARRAGVLVTGPLGLCFLPAFLAVGVAPVILGLAQNLL